MPHSITCCYLSPISTTTLFIWTASYSIIYQHLRYWMQEWHTSRGKYFQKNYCSPASLLGNNNLFLFFYNPILLFVSVQPYVASCKKNRTLTITIISVALNFKVAIGWYILWAAESRGIMSLELQQLKIIFSFWVPLFFPSLLWKTYQKLDASMFQPAIECWWSPCMESISCFYPENKRECRWKLILVLLHNLLIPPFPPLLIIPFSALAGISKTWSCLYIYISISTMFYYKNTTKWILRRDCLCLHMALL